TKLTLALRWTGDHWIAGLHQYDDPDTVFSLERCPITDGRVVDVWRGIVDASTLLPRTRRLRGAVRLTNDGASFLLEGGTHWPGAAELAARVPALTTVWWEPGGGRRRLVVDRRSDIALGPGAAARSPDASFAQVNPAAAELLQEHVLALVMAYSPASVVDAYA